MENRPSTRQQRKNVKTPKLKIITDPAQSAKEAGLVYVGDDTPGIRRKRAGKGFYFVGPDGARIRDEAQIARIRALGIPPAWTDVWI